MTALQQLLVFNIDDQQFGMRLAAVKRVERMVEITALARAAPAIFGVINVEGRIIPVFNLRRLLSLAEREPGLDDQIILAGFGGREVGLVSDSVSGVLEVRDEEVVQPDQILPAMDFIEGVVRREDGMIILYRLEEFLSLQDIPEAGQ